MEIIISLLTNPVVVAAIIGAIGAIIAAIIGIKKKKENNSEPPVIIIPTSDQCDNEGEQHSAEGIINGIEIVGTSNMDEMSLDSAEYLQALAAQGEMLKNRDTVFEVYKEET